VPVWHAVTEELRASGRLRVVGITQEQHLDRALLYAQWQGYDWPILWDPFNLTRSSVVPSIWAVDAHGVIRRALRRPGSVEEELVRGFLEVEFAAHPKAPADPYPQVRRRRAAEGEILDPETALARLLWRATAAEEPLSVAEWAEAIARLETHAFSEAGNADDRFRLGVAYRLRHDSPRSLTGDFQSAIDHWVAALRSEPGRYIWRRRIQQWGPRLDKPYAFYDWVEEAQREIAGRGEEPLALRVPLTGSEVAGGARGDLPPAADGPHPDPQGRLPRDGEGLVRIEVAVAPHTGSPRAGTEPPSGIYRVHVSLCPDRDRDVHWSNEVGPTEVFLSAPAGHRIDRRLHLLVLRDEPESSEVRRLDFEVRPAPGEEPARAGLARVRGVATYFVCEGESGRCLHLAQDFEIPLGASAPRAPDEGGR